jgi:hypothetical protein
MDSLRGGHDPDDPHADPGRERASIIEFSRNLLGSAGQFAPQTLYELASAQAAVGDAAASRATLERIVRDYPNRSTAVLAREELGDETAPTLTVAASPSTFWPPNNKLVPVTVSVTVNDDADPNSMVTLVSITCNDACIPAQDVAGATLNTDDRAFELRATRKGEGIGRTYTITYSAKDGSGNATTAQTTVRVPHDQRK